MEETNLREESPEPYEELPELHEELIKPYKDLPELHEESVKPYEDLPELHEKSIKLHEDLPILSSELGKSGLNRQFRVAIRNLLRLELVLSAPSAISV